MLSSNQMEPRSPKEAQRSGEAASHEKRNAFASAWDMVSQVGLAEAVLRLGTHTLLVALILLFAWGLREFYLGAEGVNVFAGALLADTTPTATPVQLAVNLPDYNPSGPPPAGSLSVKNSVQPDSTGSDLPSVAPVQKSTNSTDPFFLQPLAGVVRLANFHTDVPSRGREEVSQYTVKAGDSLFGIAKQFGLRPETILWANQAVLGDNPENLRPEQQLNILPVDGAYYKWSAGDGLNGVAKFYSVTPEEIIAFPANHLDPDTIGDLSNPNIEPGSWLVIPRGKRQFVSWSAPVIPLDNPGVANVLGPGACQSVTAGVAGGGAFIWPASDHSLSGYDFTLEANHPGIDIRGNEGDPVYAADSGVVVYAGWNSWGYGNVIVINHGNGWQTLYAHLSAYYVSCGQSVFQGNAIGAIGSTGNADGAHLHFEMMYNGVRVNPHDYVK